MTTRRNTVDQGQSYLDLLTNGLGAVIILFMILVGVRAPTPYSSNRSHRESAFGRVDTYRGLSPDAKHEIAQDYVVQLVMETSNPSIQPEVDAATRVLRGIGAPPGTSHWLLLRKRGHGGSWAIGLRRPAGDASEVTVLVYASLGSAVLEPKVKRVGPGGVIARVHDTKDGIYLD